MKYQQTMCVTCIIYVSESCSLIRRSSHSEVVGMHTLFITGSMELRDSQKACRDNTEMAWLPRISTYLLSVQWMVLHHVPLECLSLPGPAAVVMPHTGTTNLVILLPRGQRAPHAYSCQDSNLQLPKKKISGVYLNRILLARISNLSIFFQKSWIIAQLQQ